MTSPKVLEGKGADLLLHWVAGKEDQKIAQQLTFLGVGLGTVGEDLPCVVIDVHFEAGGMAIVMFDPETMRATGQALVQLAGKIEQAALDQASAIIAKAGRAS